VPLQSRPQILVVANVNAPYVHEDLQILEELGPTRFLFYRGRRDLPRLIRSMIKADLVICWFALGYATTCALVAKALRIPCVIIVGGWDVVSSAELGYGALLSPGRWFKTHIALRFADKVIAVSEALRGEFVRNFRFNVSVLAPGVDLSLFSSDGSASLRRRQAVCVAGIDSKVRYKIKGVDILLQVAAALPDIRFYIVGRNSEEWDLKLRQLGTSNVVIAGFLTRDMLRLLFNESKAYVQLSAYESFCVSLAEAMAAGCVPIVSDRGALPEVVDGLGFVVPYGDISSVVVAIRQAIDQPDLGLEARRRSAERFSLERRRAGLLAAVRSLL